MNASTSTATIKKMVEVDEEIIEVSVTMTKDQADVLLTLIGKMGPKQVAIVQGEYLPGQYGVDQTMDVIYEFYNTLYEAIPGIKGIR